MIIEIYSKEQCPYCNMAEAIAKKLVDSNKSQHSYTKYMLNDDFDRAKMMETFPTARTFPQIKIDGESIGGYTEFERISREY